MTFGSGASGCLGHGNHKDISQVCSYTKSVANKTPFHFCNQYSRHTIILFAV